MKIFFVRHGQTNYNVLGLDNSDPSINVHLTGLGKKQAKWVGDKLKNIKFDLVIISELPRTKETASIIMQDSKVEFKVESRINDRDTGFDGKKVTEFHKLLEPDLFNLKFNEGESFQEEKQRIFSFLKDLKKMNYENILIVTHCEVLKIINGYYNGLSDQEMWDTKINNCQVFEMNI